MLWGGDERPDTKKKSGRGVLYPRPLFPCPTTNPPSHDTLGVGHNSVWISPLLVLALDMSLTVWIYLHVQAHRVAADRAVFDVVLARPG